MLCDFSVASSLHNRNSFDVGWGIGPSFTIMKSSPQHSCGTISDVHIDLVFALRNITQTCVVEYK